MLCAILERTFFCISVNRYTVRTMSVSILSMLTGSHIVWGQIAALGTLALLPAPLAILVFWTTGIMKRWAKTN